MILSSMKQLLLNVQDTGLAMHPGMYQCQECGAGPVNFWNMPRAWTLSLYDRMRELVFIRLFILAESISASHSSCLSSVLTEWLAQLFFWLLHATSTPLASTAGSIIKTIMLERVYQNPVYSPITHLLLYSGWEME